MANFLEQLVAEWYAYRGFFVRTNIKFGPRPEGGWEGEMDVVAFEPKERALVHIETSGDADSWGERQARFVKKFHSAEEHYRDVFPWDYSQVKQVAVVSYREPPEDVNFGSKIEIVSIPELIHEIITELKDKDPRRVVVPEGYALLRAIQFAVGFNSEMH